MGRKEGAELSGAQIMYPCMQCADIFFLGAHICQLGLDQRKVNMLAREYADRKGLRPPVILSHHMLMGLGEGEEKMSKSNPDRSVLLFFCLRSLLLFALLFFCYSSILLLTHLLFTRQVRRECFFPCSSVAAAPRRAPADAHPSHPRSHAPLALFFSLFSRALPFHRSAIFMEDEAHVVKRKIKKAYCPTGVVVDNPVLDWTKHIVYGNDDTLSVTRAPENGGDKTFATYEALEEDFASGALHPGDLKPALSAYINARLEPVRQHFAKGPAKALLKQVRGFRITR